MPKKGPERPASPSAANDEAPAGLIPGRSGGAPNRGGGRARRPASPRPTARPAEEARASNPERLQKIISEAGLASRRGAERLIAAGQVKVNGQVADQLGVKADPAVDRITVQGRPLGPPQKYHYYMFNKPAGCLTTLSDPQGRPTIKPYLDRLPVRVFAVGRLDMDVEGLLILTNDGALARRLMHPSSQVRKVYRVKVAGRPDETALNKLRDGSLHIGERPAAPAEAEIIKVAADRAWLLLTIIEGRRHQVKRMCSAIGHPVLKLKRVAYGGLPLGTLRPEEIRPLTQAEAFQLKNAGPERPERPARPVR
jgi:23S rRNA pseudouridine2605 synthase